MGRCFRGRRICATFALVAALCVGCGVVFNAPEVAFVITDDGIRLASPSEQAYLVGGETIVTISNQSSKARRVVLAHLGDANVPSPSLLAADVVRDDSSILGISQDLGPRDAAFGSGQLGYQTESAEFHVHLRAGERYALFDTIADGSDGAVITFVVDAESPS